MTRVLSAALLLAVISRPALAIHIELTIKGPAGTVTKIPVKSLANPSVTAAEFNSGMALGRRKFSEFSLTRDIDKSSPSLFQAACGGSSNVTIAVFEDGVNGKLMYTIQLMGAGGKKGKSKSNELEQFSFTFKTLTWTWVKGGKTLQDSWDAK